MRHDTGETINLQCNHDGLDAFKKAHNTTTDGYTNWIH